MKIHLLMVGKTRNAHVRALVEEYTKRLTRYCRFEVEETRRLPAKILEGGRRGNSAGKLVLLDAAGRLMSSEEFAGWLAREQDAGTRELVFVLGPAEGFSEATKRRAAVELSLTPLTLSHELARVVLLEQIYRAFTILAGHPYAK